ncbi:MAG: FAD-binding oxidoreductase [Deltaproteobacteria bacterium]|nr:FAD-binding oxidoreductase [Deltaproteobacteria bacterium]
MNHEEKVAAIAAQIRSRPRGSGPASLRKSAVSHFVPNPNDPKHGDRKIDVRALDQILELDIPARRCVVEPGVTFSDLVRATLAHRLVPKLVPELKTITVGGAIAGCSVESMSYRYGGFHDSCRSYELVTGTGEILRCSPGDNSLLFEMIHGSYGTLGILTRVEFDLIPAMPYVHMDYRRLRSFADFHSVMMKLCEEGRYDFIDGIIHGRDSFVLCLGQFTDRAPWTSDYKSLNIFYKSTATRRDDYPTTYDYFFRYDTECHWLTRSLPVPAMESLPMRLLLGKVLLGSTNILNWSRRLRPLLKHQKNVDVVVDVFIPEPRVKEFYGWYEATLDYFPLWIVPYRAPKVYPWIDEDHAKANSSAYFIDCAVYGKKNDVPGVDYHKLLEDKTRELGGIKTLISQNQYDEATFWKIYHRDNYDRAKRISDPDGMFRGLYEKFHPTAPGSR